MFTNEGIIGFPKIHFTSERNAAILYTEIGA